MLLLAPLDASPFVVWGGRVGKEVGSGVNIILTLIKGTGIEAGGGGMVGSTVGSGVGSGVGSEAGLGVGAELGLRKVAREGFDEGSKDGVSLG